MQTFLWNFRVGSALFVVMFVDRWQNIGPLTFDDYAVITLFSFGICVAVQISMWVYRLILLTEKRAAMIGTDDLKPDENGFRAGRLKPLYRYGMPFALIPMGGFVMCAPLALGGWQDAISAVIASAMLILGLILVHQGAWHYTFRYRFSDYVLICANRLFGDRSHDWPGLKHITDDKAADNSVFIFEESGTARIPLFAEGHETLLRFARRRLEVA